MTASIRIGCTRIYDYYKCFQLPSPGCDPSLRTIDAVKCAVRDVFSSPTPAELFYFDKANRKICLADAIDEEIQALVEKGHDLEEIDSYRIQQKFVADLVRVGPRAEPPVAAARATGVTIGRSEIISNLVPASKGRAQPQQQPQRPAAATATTTTAAPSTSPPPPSPAIITQSLNPLGDAQSISSQTPMGAVKISLVQSLRQDYTSGEAVRIELRVTNVGQCVIPRDVQLRQITQLNMPAMISSLTHDLAPGAFTTIVISLQTIEVKDRTEYSFTFRLVSNTLTISGGEITIKFSVVQSSLYMTNPPTTIGNVKTTGESPHMDQLQVLALASGQTLEVVEMAFKKFNNNLDDALEFLMQL